MSNKPRLLVIDDNRELADNLVELFEDRGFLVEVVPSAAAALAFAKSKGFDLAFVDVNLPDSTGHELVPALREACPGGEVLLMTGQASIDSAIEPSARPWRSSSPRASVAIETSWTRPACWSSRSTATRAR